MALKCCKPDPGPDNSVITFCANLGVVVLCIINIVFLLLGIGLIVIGARVKAEIDKNVEIMDLLDLVKFGNFTLKEIVKLIIIVIIVCGGFAIVTSLIGGIGAFFALRVLLIVYIIIVVLCIIVESFVLALWIELIYKVDNTINGWFNDLLKEYPGSAVENVYSLGWDFIFIFFGCCGVKPVKVSDNDFEQLPSKWWSTGNHGSDVIPSSCCKDVTADNYLNYANTACTQNLQGYHTSGCYDVFDEIFTRLASVAISIVVILCIIEGVAIFYAGLITCAVSAKRKVGLV